jgi:hypothetical protein
VYILPTFLTTSLTIQNNMVAAERTLTVYCDAGLCNRLRVLLSGMALAEVAGRHFQMLWPRTSACAASFHSIFANAWNVVTPEQNQVDGLFYYQGWLGPELPDLLAETAPHLIVGHPSWLLRPALYPTHRSDHKRLAHQIYHPE